MFVTVTLFENQIICGDRFDYMNMFVTITVTVFENEIICGERFDYDDTVLSLKLKIQEKTGLHPRKQILSYWEYIQLEDFRTLGSYDCHQGHFYDCHQGHFLISLSCRDVNFILNLLTDYLLQLDAGHPQNEDYFQKGKRKREGWKWTNYLIKYPDRGSKEQEEERVRFVFSKFLKDYFRDATQIKKEYLFRSQEVEETPENLAILKEVMREVRPDIELIENDIENDTFNLESLGF